MSGSTITETAAPTTTPAAETAVAALTIDTETTTATGAPSTTAKASKTEIAASIEQ